MLRKIIGFILSLIFPGYSTCGRCGMPWNMVQEHTTMYQDFTDLKEAGVEVKSSSPLIIVGSMSKGCSPLCQHCWDKLKTPEKRLPYYKEMYEGWTYKDFPFEWIEKAVMNEK